MYDLQGCFGAADYDMFYARCVGIAIDVLTKKNWCRPVRAE
jgi:hypothetical protein